MNQPTQYFGKTVYHKANPSDSAMYAVPYGNVILFDDDNAFSPTPDDIPLDYNDFIDEIRSRRSWYDDNELALQQAKFPQINRKGYVGYIASNQHLLSENVVYVGNRRVVDIDAFNNIEWHYFSDDSPQIRIRFVDEYGVPQPIEIINIDQIVTVQPRNIFIPYYDFDVNREKDWEDYEEEHAAIWVYNSTIVSLNLMNGFIYLKCGGDQLDTAYIVMLRQILDAANELKSLIMKGK
jgi:hypothetical protein